MQHSRIDHVARLDAPMIPTLSRIRRRPSINEGCGTIIVSTSEDTPVPARAEQGLHLIEEDDDECHRRERPRTGEDGAENLALGFADKR